MHICDSIPWCISLQTMRSNSHYLREKPLGNECALQLWKWRGGNLISLSVVEIIHSSKQQKDFLKLHFIKSGKAIWSSNGAIRQSFYHLVNRQYAFNTPHVARCCILILWTDSEPQGLLFQKCRNIHLPNNITSIFISINTIYEALGTVESCKKLKCTIFIFLFLL